MGKKLIVSIVEEFSTTSKSRKLISIPIEDYIVDDVDFSAYVLKYLQDNKRTIGRRRGKGGCRKRS